MARSQTSGNLSVDMGLITQKFGKQPDLRSADHSEVHPSLRDLSTVALLSCSTFFGGLALSTAGCSRQPAQPVGVPSAVAQSPRYEDMTEKFLKLQGKNSGVGMYRPWPDESLEQAILGLSADELVDLSRCARESSAALDSFRVAAADYLEFSPHAAAYGEDGLECIGAAHLIRKHALESSKSIGIANIHKLGEEELETVLVESMNSVLKLLLESKGFPVTQDKQLVFTAENLSEYSSTFAGKEYYLQQLANAAAALAHLKKEELASSQTGSRPENGVNGSTVQ